ncbi:hypothetical protein LAZ67_3000372, partial [Cordylochernes scorpioides]
MNEKDKWRMGKCIYAQDPRSYIVEVVGHEYRRNRRDIKTLPSGLNLNEEYTDQNPQEEPSRSAEQVPERPSTGSQPGEELSPKKGIIENSSLEFSMEYRTHASPPAREAHGTLAAARGDVTAPPTAASSSENLADPASLNWADSEMAEVDANDDYTVVKSKKRRLSSTPEQAAKQASRPAEKRGPQLQKRTTGPRSMPPQEIKATRANIADARARQANTNHENYVFVELCPDIPDYSYLRAIGDLVGGPKNIAHFGRMNGHYIVGLASKNLASRLVEEGLNIEGTLLKVFPFRKRAERIIVANLPGFVEDATIVQALREYGDITSIAPIMIKMGEFAFSDGRREAFILLREGVRLETLPTRLTIHSKGDTLSAFLSFGIKCSKCGKQGHRRANCPALARQGNGSPRQAASPTDARPPLPPPQRPRKPAPAPATPASPVQPAKTSAEAQAIPSAHQPAEQIDLTHPAPAAHPAPLAALRPPEPRIPPLDQEMSVEKLSSPPATPARGKAALEQLLEHLGKSPNPSIDWDKLPDLNCEEAQKLLTSETTMKRRAPTLTEEQFTALEKLHETIKALCPDSNSTIRKTLQKTRKETNAFHPGSGQDLCLGYSAVVLAHPVAISGSGHACVFGPGVAVLQQRILWPGHIALATIDVHGEEMTAIAVHLAHEPRERNRQLELLAATAAQEEEGACWIIGDFNIRDRGPSSSSSSDALAALLDLAALVDVATQFDAAHLPTRVSMHGAQVESNRLDRILVPAGVLDRVSIYATSHYHLSDHRLVLLQVGPPTTAVSSPTQPRLAAMLRSGLALEHLAGYIRELEEDTAHDDDDGTFWDRWTSIKAGLLAEARSLHDPRHAANDSYVYRARRYIAAQLEASSIRADYPSLPDLARAIRLRRPVSVIRDEQDNIIEGPELRRRAFATFQPRFARPTSDPAAGAAFIASSAPTTTRELSEEDPLHRPDISPSEIANAIEHLPRGKAPGWDGLPCELLVAFSEDFFAEALARVFAASRLRGALPPSTRRSSICLVPKARGGRGLDGYRPVALPSADYRVLAAILHRRLKPHLRTLVPECQTYAVPGRSPSWNIAMVTDAIEEATALGSPLAVMGAGLRRKRRTLQHRHGAAATSHGVDPRRGQCHRLRRRHRPPIPSRRRLRAGGDRFRRLQAGLRNRREPREERWPLVRRLAQPRRLPSRRLLVDHLHQGPRARHRPQEHRHPLGAASPGPPGDCMPQMDALHPRPLPRRASKSGEHAGGVCHPAPPAWIPSITPDHRQAAGPTGEIRLGTGPHGVASRRCHGEASCHRRPRPPRPRDPAPARLPQGGAGRAPRGQKCLQLAGRRQQRGSLDPPSTGRYPSPAPPSPAAEAMGRGLQHPGPQPPGGPHGSAAGPTHHRRLPVPPPSRPPGPCPLARSPNDNKYCLIVKIVTHTHTLSPIKLQPLTAPGLPKRFSAAPAPAPPSSAVEDSGASPAARAVTPSTAPRPSPPAAPTLPMEEASPAPPPVTPAPSLRAPVSHVPAAPTPDVEMSIIEEIYTSSTSSTKTSTREGLVTFIERNPGISFAQTDALGLGREEVLDILSSKTKARKRGPLLSPSQGGALAGLIHQLLGQRPGGDSNIYKVLRQVLSELRTAPTAVPSTPPLPAPRPSGPTPPTSHSEELMPAVMTPSAARPDGDGGGQSDDGKRAFVVLAESPGCAVKVSERPSILLPTGEELSPKDINMKKTIEISSNNQKDANPPAGDMHVNPAAARGDVTAPKTAATTSATPASPASLNWADSEMAEVDDNEGFIVVKGKKRRLGSTSPEHAARQPNKPGNQRSTQQQKRPTGPRAVPPKEIKATRANIADARARQATTNHENYIFVELCPDIPDYSYLRAIGDLVGGPKGITHFGSMNGHYIVGLASRNLASRLVEEGLNIEGTLLKVFPFRKRAERIIVANLPGFVEDATIVQALRKYGDITSIAPIMIKMGEFAFSDGRREAFILLHQGVRLETLPARLTIESKGDTLSAFLSFGIKCSKCGRQGHRRASCPSLARQGNSSPRQAESPIDARPPLPHPQRPRKPAPAPATPAKTSTEAQAIPSAPHPAEPMDLAQPAPAALPALLAAPRPLEPGIPSLDHKMAIPTPPSARPSRRPRSSCEAYSANELPRRHHQRARARHSGEEPCPLSSPKATSRGHRVCPGDKRISSKQRPRPLPRLQRCCVGPSRSHLGIRTRLRLRARRSRDTTARPVAGPHRLGNHRCPRRGDDGHRPLIIIIIGCPRRSSGPGRAGRRGHPVRRRPPAHQSRHARRPSRIEPPGPDPRPCWSPIRVSIYATSHYHLSDHRLVMLQDRWTSIKAGLLAEARSLHDPRHAASDSYVYRARRYIAAQLEASSIRADYPSLPDLSRAIRLRRPVSVIRDDEDNVIEGPELRRRAFATFRPRFARPTTDPAAGAAFIASSAPTTTCELSEEDPLHRPDISPSEIANAIEHLPRGKAPGWDGLPCELLVAFNEDFFAEALVRVFAASRLRGALPPSTRRSSICLVPKARGGRDLDRYRPVALPSADYRVLAAILHRRLKPHLRTLVPECQTYAVPGRSPSWNIAKVTDAVEEATAMGSPLAAMGIDLESAFDSLDRGFLESLMTSLRLPPAFMGWINILYAGADATIRAGGFHTTAFPLLNGLRQGCAVSVALFSIATGPLLRRLELTLGVGNVIAYADDIVLLFHRDEEFERVATVLEDFKRASGIAVNLGKSAGLWCGAWRNRGDSPLGASWSTNSIRVLGLDIAPRSSVAHQEQHLLALLESACHRWTPFTRGLSLVGRSRAANSLVSSTIQHHLHGYLPSPPTIAKLQARLARFVWGPEHTAWLPAAVMARPVAIGGLGLLDLATQLQLACLKGVQVALRGGRNAFSWLVESGEAWIYPPPDGTRLQPRRLRLLKLWEEASNILSLNHRALPTAQLLDLPIIGGCRFFRPPDLLAPARWRGARVRDLLAEGHLIARPTRSVLADAATLGAFCRRLTSENAVGFGAESAPSSSSLAAAVVLRGTATPFLNGLTTRSARRALDRPHLAATPISRREVIAEKRILENSSLEFSMEYRTHASPPAREAHGTLAAARGDVTAPPTAASSSENLADPASLNWADSEMAEVNANDDYTVVKRKKRRLSSTPEQAAKQASRPAEKRGPQQQKRTTGPRSMPPQEIKATRANIADARARQANTNHENYVFVELCPDIPDYSYLRAIGDLVGGPKNIAHFGRMNGHYIVGLASKNLASRLVEEGLNIEGTLLKVFPFRKRAERIIVANLPGFVEDATIVQALREYGDITSIAPIMIKMGEFAFSDGRREAFILLREGVRLETLPTRLTIHSKGDTLSAFLSFGIKCSKCGKQGHRRANCPALARQGNGSPRQAASPTDARPPSLLLSDQGSRHLRPQHRRPLSNRRRLRPRLRRSPRHTSLPNKLISPTPPLLPTLLPWLPCGPPSLASLRSTRRCRTAPMSYRVATINARGLATRRRSLALCHLLRQHHVDIAFVQETNAFHPGSGQDLCLGYSAVVLAHPVAISGSGHACVFGPGVAVLQQRILWPGHIALATIDVHGEEMTAIAVHLAHEPRERNRQLELLAATAAQEEEGACWIIGDFNIRDRGPSSSSSSDALAALLDLAALVDVATQFDAAHLPTRVSMHGAQVESNRLDRILVPAGVLDRVSIYATSHYHLSDHRLVLLQVGPPTTAVSSPTQPRLAAMLRSGLALEHLAGYIRELEEDTAHDDDDGTFWDRWTSIKAGLLAEARSLHDPRHAANDSYVYRARRYIAAQLEASSIRADYPSLPDLARAIRLRRPVSVIRDEQDNIIEGPELRRRAFATFQPRFARPTSDPAAGAAFIASSAPTTTRELSEEDPLHRPDISPSEIANAIEHLPRGKAPGWDGLPCELLVAFSEDFFAEALARVFATSRLRGALPPSTRRSSICLVPKARGGRGLDGYRPVALPSADYRVLAAILHRRLKPHLRTLVPECQTYAVPGRSPSWNIAMVTDAIEEATALGSPLAVMGVDLESAFDSLDRGFLESLLTSLRLPPAFMAWINILYAGADATIRVGGFHTTAFPLLNGLRQGCAVSAALFSIATGPLLRRLELTLGVGNVIAYADDIVLLFHRDGDFERVATVFEDYRQASGIGVNLGKSAGLWCGAWRNRGDSPLGASWSTTSIRVLGLDIAPRSTVIHREQHLLALLETACRKWTPFTRGLSLVGRARAANTLVGSVIQHHLHGYLPSPPTIAKLQARLARFVWGQDHTAWLPADVMARPVAIGGFGLLDLATQLQLACLKGVQVALRGGRNAFSWLVGGNSGEAWIHPPPDGTRLQPRRLRLLKLWEEASNILGLNHRAVPTAQLLDLPIIGGCRFLRPPDLLAPARWRGARVRDLIVEENLIARPTRSALADAATLGAFCLRLTSENAVGFGAESTPSSSSLAAAVVLRGTATPFLNGLTTRSARRALDRPRLAATPISRFLARWTPTINPPSRIDWASLRRCAYSGHEADAALKLALHALPHPAHPASVGPSCPACGSIDRSLSHRYWCCPSIRPLIREAFNIIGRPPDLQAWIFGGSGLEDDALSILASAKLRIYRCFVQVGLGEAVEPAHRLVQDPPAPRTPTFVPLLELVDTRVNWIPHKSLFLQPLIKALVLTSAALLQSVQRPFELAVKMFLTRFNKAFWLFHVDHSVKLAIEISTFHVILVYEPVIFNTYCCERSCRFKTRNSSPFEFGFTDLSWNMDKYLTANSSYVFKARLVPCPQFIWRAFTIVIVENSVSDIGCGLLGLGVLLKSVNQLPANSSVTVQWLPQMFVWQDLDKEMAEASSNLTQWTSSCSSLDAKTLQYQRDAQSLKDDFQQAQKFQ